MLRNVSLLIKAGVAGVLGAWAIGCCILKDSPAGLTTLTTITIVLFAAGWLGSAAIDQQVRRWNG